MLPAAHRLRRPMEVKRVRAEGRAYRHPLVILIVAPALETAVPLHQEDGGAALSRFAFVASRRVGGAVRRNRCKRLLREAVRHQLPRIEPGWDCIWIARQPLGDAAFNDVQAAVTQQLRRARLISRR